eukprot:1155881-Pelagomonas_calceolata.AAC.1
MPGPMQNSIVGCQKPITQRQAACSIGASAHGGYRHEYVVHQHGAVSTVLLERGAALTEVCALKPKDGTYLGFQMCQQSHYCLWCAVTGLGAGNHASPLQTPPESLDEDIFDELDKRVDCVDR